MQVLVRAGIADLELRLAANDIVQSFPHNISPIVDMSTNTDI